MRSLALLLCLAVCVTGCSSDDGGPGPIDLDLTLETYPAVDGSTSAHPLAMLIACRVLGVPHTWRDNPMGGTRRLVPDETAAETSALAQALGTKIVHNGTHGAYAAVRADLDPQSSARRLHDWLLTAQGQAVVAESGYVPAR